MTASFHAGALMADILIIKTSSLGDVVHQMPAITDARRARPDARIAWMVEEAFAPLALLHPGVDHIIPVAWRRWRRALHKPATWGEIAAFLRAVRAQHYDEIVDTQGLLRTGLIARAARGRRQGYASTSIREPLASLFYDVRHAVERRQHAIARNRALTGLALGYAPGGAIDYGLARKTLTEPAAPYAVLLHATTRADKEWPVEHWIALGQALQARGLAAVLPWGTQAERARSEKIAAALAGARVPERRPLDEVARLLAGAALVVGVDTGLVHVAAALGVPLVAIFSGSDPDLTGPKGAGPMAVLGARSAPPAVDEVVKAAEAILPAR
jgi:heptosyltransferase I